MGKQLSCKACRAKKTKCTGELPICSECTSRGKPEGCEYATTTTTAMTTPHPVQAHRGRGEACMPCRKKKKRCDGERPICQACICLKKEHLCFYEVISSVTRLQEENQAYKDKIRYLEQALTLSQPPPNSNASYGPSFASSSNSDASSSTSDRVGSSEPLLPLPCMTVYSHANGPSEWPLVPSTSTSLQVSQPAHAYIPHDLSVDAVYGHLVIPTGSQHHVTPVHPLSDPQYSLPLPSHATHPTLHSNDPSLGLPRFCPSQAQLFRPIDPTVSFHTPSDLVPIVFPVFASTTDPLALARYYTFSRGLIFGLRFTSAKTQALINGDLSHTLIHPAIVHASTLWGLALIARYQGHLLDDAVQASHYSAAYASLLVPPTTRESAVDDIQARAVLALYEYNKKNLVAGGKWLREAVWTVRQAGLQVTLPNRTSGVRNDVTLYIAATAEDQERDALCNLAYVDMGNKILLDTESNLDEETQTAINRMLMYCDEHSDHASMAIFRLMTLTLLFETLNAYRGDDMALYSAHSAFDVSILTYIKRARRLLAHLEGPILLLGGSEHGHAAFIVLQECVIITQCVLAISYLSLARQGHLEGKRRAMSAISELVSVTKTLEQEDMDAIDPFPMYCWNFLSSVLLRERNGQGWLEGALPSATTLLELEQALQAAQASYVQGCIRFSGVRAWIDKFVSIKG